MPRILSNSSLHHRRQSSISSSSMLASSNSYQQSVLIDWFNSLTGHSGSTGSKGSLQKRNSSSTTRDSSKVPSAASTTDSSPLSSSASSGRNTPPTDPSDNRCRFFSQSNTGLTPSILATATMKEVDDTWGLFVDTEEAEKELVKHSGVLSRKELPNAPLRYHLIHP